ncbi:hypothetical protein K1719_020622 [Acacia pycnantha]|nr:hypothetical protein K1719_020622 [Acacia pycnantha]
MLVSEPALMAGASRPDQDTWKVVTKPHRQKKMGKERSSELLRQGDAGSRFGVLAEAEVGESGDCQKPGKPAQPVSAVEVFHSQGINPALSFKDRKGENKKRQNRGKVVSGNVSKQRGGRRYKEREKRREAIEKETKSKEVRGYLMLKSRENDKYGKFWAASDSLDPENEMNEEDLGDCLLDSLVPETQLPGGQGSCDRNFFQHIKLATKASNPSCLLLSETKSISDTRFGCLRKLGYDQLDFVPSEGRSGGLLAAWKSDYISVSVLRKNRQILHLLCSLRGKPPLLISAIYAIPTDRHKQLLWQELHSISSTNSPWVVIGDFNDILASDERVGGAEVNFSRIQRFQDRIQAALSRFGI